MLLQSVFSEAMANPELTLNSNSNFNPTFQNHFSLLFGVNPSIIHSSDVTHYSLSYIKKMDDFWLDTNLNFTNGLFSKMTTNNQLATGLTNNDLIESKSSMTTIGLGVGRESQYAKSLIPIQNLYELMAADLTYNLFKEPTSGKSFTGPGIMAKFSLYKKFSDYFSVGANFVYNLAVVKRSAVDETENSAGRSLTVSTLTTGFDISFYL